jgi:hypothetical protein
MPSASDAIANTVNAGAFRNLRKASCRSWKSGRIGRSLHREPSSLSALLFLCAMLTKVNWLVKTYR